MPHIDMEDGRNRLTQKTEHAAYYVVKKGTVCFRLLEPRVTYCLYGYGHCGDADPYPTPTPNGILSGCFHFGAARCALAAATHSHREKVVIRQYLYWWLGHARLRAQPCERRPRSYRVIILKAAPRPPRRPFHPYRVGGLRRTPVVTRVEL